MFQLNGAFESFVDESIVRAEFGNTVGSDRIHIERIEAVPRLMKKGLTSMEAIRFHMIVYTPI